MKDTITQNFDEHNKVIKELLCQSCQDILKDFSSHEFCFERGNTIFWCGNGGSASDSQHIAAELVGRFRNDASHLSQLH